MNVFAIDPHEDPQWIEYITAHDAATIFHHPQWLRTLELSYGFRATCFAAAEENKLVGVLPLMEARSWLTGRRGVCLPFSDACTPLCDQPATAGLLVSHACRLVQPNHWRYLEVRGDTDTPLLSVSEEFKMHLLRLTRDGDQVFGTFKRSRIRGIMKAGREGVTVERRQDAQAMQEFVRLNTLTRKKLGVPPQPDSFFGHLYDQVVSRNHGFVSLALLRGSVIAAGVFLHFKNQITYKYGASDETYLKHCPNDILMGDAIRWGCDHDFRVFDFGRTDADNQGLLNFKRSFGAEERDLRYYRMFGRHVVSSANATGTMKKLKPVFQRTPAPLLKLVGRFFYSHGG